MMKGLYALLFSLLLPVLTIAQIITGTDTLFGNEWIRYDQAYFKIMVAEDGMYSLGAQTMLDAGVPLSQVQGSQFQLFHNGKEVPLYVSTDGAFGSNDYLEFYGKKNTSELDQHLFAKPDEDMMNPQYSLVTDTAAYFLTWTTPGAPVARYQNLNNDLTNLPPKEPFCWFQQEQVFSNSHDKKKNSQGVANSFFDTAEGYASPYALTQSVNFSAVQPFQGSQNATLEVRFACGNGEHGQVIKINGTLVSTENFFGYKVLQKSFAVANASLTSQVQLTLEGTASNNDRQRIAFASLRYPRHFDFGGAFSFTFELDAAATRQYLEITNFSTTFIAPVLYDLTNGLRIQTTLDAGNVVKAVLPPSAVSRQLLLLNASTGAKPVNSLQPVSFINYFDLKGDYIILSNAKLFDDGSGVNLVQEYANYRSSAAGGNFKPIIVEVQQLYDQFAWGLNRHPLAVRNFGHFVRKYWTNPNFLFIIGSAREYRHVRTAPTLNDPSAKPILVPTFGAPGSDNLLTAWKGELAGRVPIGRLAATTPQHVRIYLDKVKGFEKNKNLPQTIGNRQWMKHVIHLGGGGNAGEQSLIRSNLEAMAHILGNGLYGAKVEAFYKTSTDPIQQSQSQRISELINNGVSIVNFFGHSGAEGFDFSVDNPTTYQNKDKYPLVVSMGCFSGQIHDNINSIGEQFIFQQDKGAIAFLATAGYGYISSLNQVAQNFYTKLGGSHYGKGLGRVLRDAYADFQNADYGSQVLIQQFTYHGDPAIVLNVFDGPDYTIDPISPSISPARVNAQDMFFQFSFNVLNIGKAIADSLEVEISRQFPNNSVQVVERRKVPAPNYEKRLEIKIPVQGLLSTGFNRLLVTIDPDDKISESQQPEAELNNEVIGADGSKGFRFYVFPNGITAAYPERFSIVNKKPLTLKAFTSDPFAVLQKYYFEMDTTEYFNSPIKQSQVVEQTGGVVTWTPSSPLLDNTVYYWRVSPDSVLNQGLGWSSSSFLYKEGSKEGWNQSHFFQLGKNSFNNVELPESTRKLKYFDDVKTIKVLNGVYPNVWPSMGINNDSYVYLPWDGPITGGVYISVFDSLTVDAWINNPPGDYGSHVSPWAYWAAYPYWTTSQANREKAMNFLNNVVPSKNYVLLFTIQTTTNNYKPEDWAADSVALGTNLFQVLEQQGAKLIRGTAQTGARPYVFFYKKDDPSYTPIEKVVGLDESIIQSFYVNGIWHEGFVETSLIGPSANWDSLHWQLSGAIPNEDSIALQVYGVKSDSLRVLLFDNQKVPALDLSSINAKDFPYLRLRYHSLDSIHRTPPNLDYWRVYYEGLPDAAVDPSTTYLLDKDTLQEGAQLRYLMAIKNLGNYDMDSLLVRFLIINRQNQVIEKMKRLPPLLKDNSITAELLLDTKGLQGNHELWIEVNPSMEQPEITHINNVAISQFFVKRDIRNPLLDVTFDGRHILDGDLVSTKPHIVMTTQDENPYLLLNDTSLFKVLLKYPDNPSPVYIPFDGQTLRFTPAAAGSGKNKAVIEFFPHFLQDGEYALIVQARDASGNAAGTYDFKVAFQVITKSMISNFLNYPNPFSTSTRFVYTLTGEEPPAQFKIQILTVSGRIVREITQDEIGPMRIGTHQTDYAWDGRDEFGDKLANGVYLYRVTAKKANGEEFELMENSGVDKFFKGGYGKMVIVR